MCLVAKNSSDTGSLKLLEKIAKQDTSKSKSSDNSVARFQEENPLLFILRPSVDNNGRLLQGATVGTSHQKDTARVNKYLRMKQVQELLPKNLKLVWEVKPINDIEYADYFRLIALKITNRDGLPALVITRRSMAGGTGHRIGQRFLLPQTREWYHGRI